MYLIFNCLKNLFLTIDEELVLLEKYQLSPNELFTIRMLLLAKEEYAEEYMFRFLAIPEEMRGDVRETLISLQGKGVILKSYKIPKKGEVFCPEDVPFNQAFLRNFFRASFEMGKELYDSYPPETIVNGISYKLRRISKKFYSMEDAYRAYGKAINWNPERHQEVLKLVNWGANNGYQFTTLDDFIVDNDWNNIKLMKERNSVNASHTFDGIKSL